MTRVPWRVGHTLFLLACYYLVLHVNTQVDEVELRPSALAQCFAAHVSYFITTWFVYLILR